MSRLSLLVLLVATALLSSACKVSVNSGGPRYTGAGITFVMPLESSEVTHGTNGIDYKSEALRASTDGHNLYVNGKLFHSVKAGDVVDFSEKGVIRINGVVSSSDGT